MGGQNCIDYDYLTVSSTALGLDSGTVGIPDRAKGCVITLENSPVRYRIDGTDPTATEGHLFNVGGVLSFDSWTVPSQNWRQSLKAIRFIRTNTDAKLKISYFD